MNLSLIYETLTSSQEKEYKLRSLKAEVSSHGQRLQVQVYF